MPIARPFNVFFILPMICKAGEGFSRLNGRCGSGSRWQFVEPQTVSNPLGEVFFDVSQMADHRFAHMFVFDLRKLKDQCGCDMGLFMRSLAQIELPRLAVVVGEAFGTDAAFFTGFGHCCAMKAVCREFRVASSWTRSWAHTRHGPAVAPSACARHAAGWRTDTWGR